VEAVEDQFQCLYNINAMNVTLLRLQGNYLKSVIKNIDEASKIIEQE